MKTVVRIVFGLNALYQFAAGIMALFVPAAFMKFYSVTSTDVFLFASSRALGANIIFGAIISVYIAWNPEKRNILLRLMGMLALLTLIGWGMVYMNHELPLSTLLGDIIVQVIIIATVILYGMYNSKRAQA